MTLPLAEQIVEVMRTSGSTVACAESLTGGLVCSALVDVPGASDVLLGGVVAYAPAVKASVLGVPTAVLDAHGTVHPGTAEHMARGVARLLGATHAVATTGVAGPGPAEGHPAGTVLVAVRAPDAEVRVRTVRIDGDRAGVRAGAVEAALLLLLETVSG